MDIIDQLIKSLQDAKEALEKDAANPKLAPKEVKIKQLQGQIDAGTYKPDSKKIAGAMLKEEEPHKDDPNHEKKEKKAASKIKEEAEDILDLHKEELMCSANGQWNLKKAAPKLSSHSADPEVKADWTKQAHKPVFSMDHVNQVASMKDHGAAKKHAHSIVDSSSAKDETKHKIKSVINSSKNAGHLATAMSNHILAHQGLNVVGNKK